MKLFNLKILGSNSNRISWMLRQDGSPVRLFGLHEWIRRPPEFPSPKESLKEKSLRDCQSWNLKGSPHAHTCSEPKRRIWNLIKLDRRHPEIEFLTEFLTEFLKVFSAIHWLTLIRLSDSDCTRRTPSVDRRRPVGPVHLVCVPGVYYTRLRVAIIAVSIAV